MLIAELEAGVVEAACAGGDAAFAERIKQRGGKIMYDAPLFVGIFAHPAKFSGVDAGIAVHFFMHIHAQKPQSLNRGFLFYVILFTLRPNLRSCQEFAR